MHDSCWRMESGHLFSGLCEIISTLYVSRGKGNCYEKHLTFWRKPVSQQRKSFFGESLSPDRRTCSSVKAVLVYQLLTTVISFFWKETGTLVWRLSYYLLPQSVMTHQFWSSVCWYAVSSGIIIKSPLTRIWFWTSEGHRAQNLTCHSH